MSEEARQKRLRHPDDLVRVACWTAPRPRVPSSTRIATTVTRCADSCAKPGCGSRVWVLKTMTGHGQNKRRLREPEPICMHCSEPWEQWDEVNHKATGTAPGSAITKRGRWTRYIKVRATRPAAARSFEERLFGRVDLHELHTLRRLAQTFQRSQPWYWQAHIYFEYALHFGRVRGRGGKRALADVAARRWRGAPFPWNRDRIRTLVAEGRAEWARRLVEARIIDEGDWWQEDESES